MSDFILSIILGLIVLYFMMIFNGCSGLGVDLAQTRTYAITKPPFQIVVSGDLSNADKTAVRELIQDLDKTEFKDYKFNDKIQVSVIGSESDIENVNIKNINGSSKNEEE